jgi:hypothetical protein
VHDAIEEESHDQRDERGRSRAVCGLQRLVHDCLGEWCVSRTERDYLVLFGQCFLVPAKHEALIRGS